jgi:hypothetical protein
MARNFGSSKRVVLAGKNPGNMPFNILMNNRPSGVSGSGFYSTLQFQLNDPSYEPSDWAAAHTIIWDTALSDDELASVSQALFDSLTTTAIDVTTLGVNSTTCRCFVAMPECSVSSSTGPQAACLNCTRCLPGAITSPLCSASSCMPCPYGMWSTSPKATTCSYCAAATYAMSAGATACLTCPAAKFGPFAGMSACFNVSDCALIPCVCTAARILVYCMPCLMH